MKDVERYKTTEMGEGCYCSSEPSRPGPRWSRARDGGVVGRNFPLAPAIPSSRPEPHVEFPRILPKKYTILHKDIDMEMGGRRVDTVSSDPRSKSILCSPSRDA